MLEANQVVDPSLLEPGSTGVVTCSVPRANAEECAAFLAEHWRDGELRLGAARVTGYTSYSKTLSAHDSEQQRLHTLLMTNGLLPSLRESLPGFAAMEQSLADWLHRRHGAHYSLFFAHGLRQSPETLASTGFAVHQDTEDFDFIECALR